VGTPLLVEYYGEIPEPRAEDPQTWEIRLREGLEEFRQKTVARYTEGTLHRLLHSGDARARRAAVLALGLTGTLKGSNPAVALMLHDDDRGVRRLAIDALWSLWTRAGGEPHATELTRLVGLRNRRRKLAGFDALIAAAPGFAEAYNQRAIVHFQLGDWPKALADYQQALRLNPYHFGAAAGLGRCHLKLGKDRPALRAFRNALRLNPAMEEIEEMVRKLESALGGEGRKDDKK
jgi:tetratricopeptide (TPR) repeat protein